MDKNKNTQDRQGQGQKHTGQQNPPNQGQQQGSRNKDSQPTRDQAEGSRDKSRTGMGTQERGTGSQGEKNRSGISNRGMSSDVEQIDVPSRGSSDDDFQSER